MSDTALIFDDLEISGFMSFPPKILQKINLNTNRLTAIIGQNLDIGPGERNGAGKTAMLDALLYLHFGKTFRVTSNQSLVNNADPGPLLVIGTARRAGIAFRVERGENPSCLRLFEKLDGDNRDWYTKEDGKFLFERTKSTKPETTKRIAELIGFDLKLTDILLFNTPSDKSCFFLKSEEDQRNAVERIFGFTIFTEKAERLRELRRTENKNLTTKEAALIATRQANERILKQIEGLEENSTNWAGERDKTIRFLTQQIKTYQSIDFEAEIEALTQVHKITTSLAEMHRESRLIETNFRQTDHRQKQWQQKHASDLTSLEATIQMLRMGDAEADIQTLNAAKELRDELMQVTTAQQSAKHEAQTHESAAQQEHNTRERLLKQINALEQQIIQLDDQICPTCGQDWHENEHHLQNSIAALQQQTEELEALDARLLGIAEQRKAATDKLAQLDALKAGQNERLHTLPATTFKSVEEAAAAHTRLAELLQKQELDQQAVNPHDEPLQHLLTQYEEIERQVQSYHNWLQSQGKTYYAALVEAQKALAEYGRVKQQFDETQRSENPYRETIDNLRAGALKEVDETEIKALKNRVEHMSLLIDLLGDRDSPIRRAVLNEWLPQLNQRVNHYLNVLELPHRIEFDSNMTATFTKDDKTLSFGNFSTGERLRVWLATNRAFREIFELINFRINLFWVDEMLDKGLSTRGAEVSYRFLERMVQEKKSVFLITHRQELADIADNLMVVSLENGFSSMREAA